MFIVVLPSHNVGKCDYIERSLKKEGVATIFVVPDDTSVKHNPLESASGLFITGDGYHTADHGWGVRDLSLVNQALELDVPVLATGLGVFLLNQAFGGKFPRSVVGHAINQGVEGNATSLHTIYISPGSKSAAILGLGGFFKVNSRHAMGISELQRSPRLLASAYSVEDGVIEGLESPEHSWVIGFQANIERQNEAPKLFRNIFLAFLDRVEGFSRNRPTFSQRIGPTNSETEIG